jgi:hypothetical protein
VELLVAGRVSGPYGGRVEGLAGLQAVVVLTQRDGFVQVFP